MSELSVMSPFMFRVTFNGPKGLRAFTLEAHDLDNVWARAAYLGWLRLAESEERSAQYVRTMWTLIGVQSL